MNSLRNGYLAKYFKSFSFIPTLFIASILSTVFILAERYGIISGFTNGNFPKNFNLYTIITCCYYVLLYSIFALSTAKKKRLCSADYTNFAIILTCIAYVLYTLFVSKKITVLRIAIPSGIFAFMLLICSIRKVYFNPYEDNGTIYYTKNSINAYYHALFKNYSFFAILLFSIALTCLSYVILRTKTVINFSSSGIVIPIILAGVILSLLIYNSIAKMVGILDASVLSLTVTLIPTLLQILLLHKNSEVFDTYMIYWAVFVGIALILTLLRFIFFDISKIGKNTAEHFEGNRIIAYFKKVSSKYGLCSVLTTSFVATAIFILMLLFANPLYFIRPNDAGGYSILFPIIPTMIINLVFVGAVGIGLIVSGSTLKAPKITFGDFMMLVNLIFSLASMGVFLLKNAIGIKFYALAFVFAYSLIMLIIRIPNACRKSIDEI
ncbi:MAG: hypothetical protein IJW43_05720 [Clostridia bacterium]|nr:hypothetical protein [Clostridia bacterium]